MKNLLLACLLVGLVLLTGCPSTSTSSSVTGAPSPDELERLGFFSPNIARVTAEEFKLMYNNNEPVILVDTRARDQYLSGYIPGARNIPNDPWETSFNELTKLPKDRLIITYCDCPDDEGAAIAAERLLLSDYVNVKILWKGIFYWQDIGGEVRQ